MRRHFVFVAAWAATLALAQVASSAPILAIDVDDRTTQDAVPPNTVPGFQSFTLTGTTGAAANTTRTLGAFTVAVTAVNASGAPQGGIDDRDRSAPTTAPTLNQLYDDFMFTASGVGVGGGIDLTIDNGGGTLLPNTPYRVSVYAYDNDSSAAPVPRTAEWFDGNSGDSLLFETSFTGGVSPTTDDQYKHTAVAFTNAAGSLFLRARNTTPLSPTGGITQGVFLNGLEVNEIPEPASLGLLGMSTVGVLWIRRRKTA